jgi:hypothetical protein|tara:strand:+ start:1335 stop:1634 length:300 start_codon:yes stop_codon:yes gene_type:complete
MAKRKTPKVDKVVDLKPKAEKITDEQLQKLQKSVGNINRAKTELGALELQKHSIVKIIEELGGALNELRTEFKNDYGTDNININDGSIMYSEENVKANS